MGRKSLKKQNRITRNTNFTMNRNNLYINNISISQMFEIIDDQESIFASTILLNLMIAGISMITMSQIAISSAPEKSDYVDKLPSYKDMKKKFITNDSGRTLAACSGIAKAFPWIMQDPNMIGDDGPKKIGQIIVDLVENPSPNAKRIRPSIADWQNYLKGEMSGGLGQMISCPSTNLKTINIDGTKVKEYGLEEAISAIGINKDTLEKYNISTESLKENIKDIYLLSNQGIPIQILDYDEPNTIFSKIQKEILGDKLKRNGKINFTLEKGLEPESSITKSIIEKFLNNYELIAYNFAIRSGDKNILKKYTDLVKERSLKK